MAETQVTTNAIQTMLVNTAPYVAVNFINQDNTYPYAVEPVLAISGVSLLNDAGTALTLTLTFEDTSSFVIPVNANGVYNGSFSRGNPIVTINCDGTDFTIELLARDA